jgi:predicted ribosome quality control (RQC) complex YloA/Tae2 family protein
MPLNFKEIELILNELQLQSAVIQNISQPDFYSLYIEFYKPGQKKIVKIDLRAQISALYAVSFFKKSHNKLRFFECLKSALLGGKVECVEQVNRQRIIMFHVKHYNQNYYLLVRLWGPRSNIFLCDEKFIIIDAFYRRPKSCEIHGAVFNMPPADSLPKAFSIRNYPEESSFNHYIAQSYEEKEINKKKADEPLSVQEYFEKIKNEYLRYRQTAQQALDKLRNIESDRHKADLLSSLPAEQNRYQKSVEVIDFNNGSSIEIKLDDKKTLRENIDEYYKKYRKNKAARERLQRLYEKNEHNLKIWEQGAVNNYAGIQLKYHAYYAAVLNKKKEKSLPEFGIRLHYKSFIFFIGRSADDNLNLLKYCVKGNDWWFHVRHYAGAYVFIKAVKGKSLPDTVILAAAALAQYYSKARLLAEVNVVYTQVKYLKHNKKGKKGEVIPFREKNIFYRFNKNSIDELLPEKL